MINIPFIVAQIVNLLIIAVVVTIAILLVYVLFKIAAQLNMSGSNKE